MTSAVFTKCAPKSRRTAHGGRGWVFDPNECFIAAGITHGTEILKSGTPVFVTLSATRDRHGGLSSGSVTVLRSAPYGLECAKGGKPGLWVGADGVVAPREGN